MPTTLPTLALLSDLELTRV